MQNALDDAVKELEGAADVEALAEEELLKAAQKIEQAARALEEEASKRQKSATGELTFEDSVFDAAGAITEAVKLLIKAAADAQSERVRKGRSGDPNAAKYHRDPMWAEGLISAAHQVAEATKLLVHCANEVAKGKMDNHHLISAARQVGAATMQLVHATKAKSDRFSETTGKLDRAAKAIQEATEALVRAAMKKRETTEAAIRSKYDNAIVSVHEAFEKQAEILRLEEALRQAHLEFSIMKKSRYQDAVGPTANPTATTKDPLTGTKSGGGAQNVPHSVADARATDPPKYDPVLLQGAASSKLPSYQLRMERTISEDSKFPISVPKAKTASSSPLAPPKRPLSQQQQQPQQKQQVEKSPRSQPPPQQPQPQLQSQLQQPQPQQPQPQLQQSQSPPQQPQPQLQPQAVPSLNEGLKREVQKDFKPSFLPPEKQMEKFLSKNENEIGNYQPKVPKFPSTAVSSSAENTNAPKSQLQPSIQTQSRPANPYNPWA
jgi:hypothetical protein